MAEYIKRKTDLVSHNDLAGRDEINNHTKISPLVDSVNSIQFNKADNITNVLSIDTLNRKIGIRTSNPLGILSVGTDGIDDSNLKVQISTDTIGAGIAYFAANRGPGDYGALFGWDSVYGGVVIRSVNASDSINFLTSNTINAMKITPIGNVGIGTEEISSYYKLDVGGPLRVGGNSAFFSEIFEVCSDSSALESYFSSNVGEAFIEISGASQYDRASLSLNGSEGWSFSSNPSKNYNLKILRGSPTSGSERLRITSTGNVGIGTTIDPPKKLSVCIGTTSLPTTLDPNYATLLYGGVSTGLGIMSSSSGYGFVHFGNENSFNSCSLEFYQPALRFNLKIDGASIITARENFVCIGHSNPPNHILSVCSGSTTLPSLIDEGITALLYGSDTGNTGLGIMASNTGYSYIHFGDTNDSDVGQIYYKHDTNTFAIISNTKNALRISELGNITIGEAPILPWGSVEYSIQIGPFGAISSHRTNCDTFNLTQNVFRDTNGNWVYASSRAALLTQFSLSNFAIYTVPVGTKGAIIDDFIERFTVSNAGLIYAPDIYASTTAASANVYVSSDGRLTRATSSIKYKENVENIEDSYSENIYNMRPVWYRSKCKDDNPKWGWWGFVAEELAEIDPRLVNWGYSDEDYKYKSIDGIKKKQLKKEAKLKPNGVMYDRITVLLVKEIQKLNKKIEELESKETKCQNP